LHLDDPFYERYLDWLGGMLRGDFGESFFSHQKVLDVVAQAAPVTGELTALALLMALAVAVPTGMITAYRRGGLLDRLWTLASSGLVSSPPFVTALVLVYATALRAKNLPIHFPASGWADLSADPLGNLRHAFVPSLTLALALVPLYTNLLRADMAATLREDYITAARAKGLPTHRILLFHALRPSSFSLVTLAGISVGQLMSGAAIVEVLFGLPGLGQQLVNAINSKDAPLVQGLVMVIAIVYVLLNMAVDLAYRFLDPRIAAEGRRA
jgi:peptide/nickel transport system permease protein